LTCQNCSLIYRFCPAQPTTYNLLKAAQLANPEREWSLKLDQKIFELAIDDLVNAARGYGNIDHTSVRWSVRIKESDFYGRWDTFDARQQVMLLDFTSEVSRLRLTRSLRRMSGNTTSSINAM